MDQESLKEALGDRRHPCEVTFESGEQVYRGTSMHFSERGMMVMCKNPAPLNAKGKLVLRFPGFKNLIEIQGEVVWTNVFSPGDSLSPRGMGIKYVNADRDTERLLADLAAQYESLSSIYGCYYT